MGTFCFRKSCGSSIQLFRSLLLFFLLCRIFQFHCIGDHDIGLSFSYFWAAIHALLVVALVLLFAFTLNWSPTAVMCTIDLVAFSVAFVVISRSEAPFSR